MSSPASSPAAIRDWPPVSVIMPVLNEGPYLADAVDRILANGYAGELEIVLAVGPSSDGTERIAAHLAERNGHVVVVQNPTGRTPHGLNAALRATEHEIVVRVDAHGFLPAGYISRVVELLEETGAANVGGQMVPEGRTPFERAVARAMSSRLGIGGAPFHIGGEPGPADSVYLGTFRRSVLEQLGGFDEEFVRAQDWELNFRIRASGRTVWFDPGLRVGYRPRSSFAALLRQFHGSGQWRRQIVDRHPETASLRYLAPPVALVAAGVGAVAATVGVLVGSPVLRSAAVLPAGYAGVVLLGAAVEGRGLDPAAWVRLPGVVVAMHMSWGLGFLRGAPRRG